MEKLDTLKGKIVILLTAMTISAVIVFGAAARYIQHSRTGAAARKAVSEPPVIGYTIREWNGAIGIFRGNSPSPYRTVHAGLNLLPEADRTALEHGIQVQTEKELRKLLEDWDIAGQ